MARLSSKRRSFVRTLREWPSDTRKRGLGFLHDQIWFPIDPAEYLERPSRDHPEYASNLDGTGASYWRLYMDRRMLWFGWTLRLHTFYMGDDDAAVHDHPWWFVTFPFSDYVETVQTEVPAEFGYYHICDDYTGEMKSVLNSRIVRAWWFHFRSALHRHFVHDPGTSFRTLVLTGRVTNNWSFWPEDRRVRHREWTNYNREVEG